MCDTELKSFVTKFHQLRNAGFDAHLNLHARGGGYFVGLCVQLHQAGQQPHQQQKQGLRRSPAYHRRQERRRAARQAAASVPGAPAAEAEVQGEEEHGATAGEAAVHDEDVPGAIAGEAAVHDQETQTEEVSDQVIAKKSNIIVNSECRKIQPGTISDRWQTTWLNHGVSLIEFVIMDTIASIEEFGSDTSGTEWIKCKHCKRYSKSGWFHEHHCSRSRDHGLFFRDVKAMAEADPEEVVAICSI